VFGLIELCLPSFLFQEFRKPVQVCITAGDDNSPVPIFLGDFVDFFGHVLITSAESPFFEEDKGE